MSLLAISPTAADFDRRGFHADDARARRTLEQHAHSFIAGYNAAVERSDLAALVATLETAPAAERGFTYEGAAMALALRDLLQPFGGRRLAAFLHGPGAPHVYMVHVGAGWALARLRLRPGRRLPALDPFLRWLALDGYGFHEAFFHTRRTVLDHAVPRRLTGYERRAFDQGVGRALWFVDGGDLERAAATLERFATSRRADLWSGLALAVTYTVVADGDEFRRLRDLGAGYAQPVAQGAAFAVAARERAGNLLPSTRAAALILCDRTVEQVVADVRAARGDRADDPSGEGYDAWRVGLGRRLTAPVHEPVA